MLLQEPIDLERVLAVLSMNHGEGVELDPVAAQPLEDPQDALTGRPPAAIQAVPGRAGEADRRY